MKDKNEQLTSYLLDQIASNDCLQIIPSSKYLGVSELFFEHGTDYLSENNTVMAIQWLQRCYNLIFDKAELSFGELQIQTVQNLVRAHMAVGNEDNLELAARLLDQTAEVYPIAPWMYFLRLDYACKKWPTDVNRWSGLMESMIRIVQLSEDVFCSVLARLHTLYAIEQETAWYLLELLISRVKETKTTDWFEKAVILRVWMATNCQQQQKAGIALEALKLFLHKVEPDFRGTIGTTATCAAQLVCLARSFLIIG